MNTVLDSMWLSALWWEVSTRLAKIKASQGCERSLMITTERTIIRRAELIAPPPAAKVYQYRAIPRVEPVKADGLGLMVFKLALVAVFVFSSVFAVALCNALVGK